MIDKASADWPGMKTWLEAKIEEARVRLESPNCRAIAEADQLRGEIAAYRGIIATVEVRPFPLVAPARDSGGPY